MKKMVRKLFLLGLLALSSNAYAQQKGDMFVGGNIGFEIATGFEMSLGVRMLIVVPLATLAGVVVAEK